MEIFREFLIVIFPKISRMFKIFADLTMQFPITFQ